MLIHSRVDVLNRLTGLSVEETKLHFPEIKTRNFSNTTCNAKFLDESDIITKCAFDVSDPALFMFYTFTVGFVIPAILISFFYLRVNSKNGFWTLITRFRSFYDYEQAQTVSANIPTVLL